MNKSTIKSIATILGASALGSQAGYVSGALLYNKSKEAKDLINSKINNIESEKYIKQYAPDLSILDTKNKVRKSSLGFFDKLFLNANIPENGKKWNNAFYIPNKDNSAIAVPKKVNKYIIGHEIGHHIDLKGKGPGFFSTGIMGAITGRTVDYERRAWEKSPVKEDKDIKNTFLGSYENARKYTRIGLGVGAVAGTVAAIPRFLRR